MITLIPNSKTSKLFGYFLLPIFSMLIRYYICCHIADFRIFDHTHYRLIMSIFNIGVDFIEDVGTKSAEF